jgi:hypothetical protein
MRPGASEPEAEAAGGEGPIAVYDHVSLDGGKSFVEVVAIPPGCADEWPGAIDLEIATVQVRRVHRSEVIEGPQPVPLTCKVYGKSRGERTPVMRTWRPQDVPRCKLCAICNTFDRPEAGDVACLVGVMGTLAEADPLVMDTGAVFSGEVDLPISEGGRP